MSSLPTIAVIGLGFVGLPLVQLFASKGYHVTGIDIDQEKIAMLRAAKSYISDISDQEIGIMTNSGLLDVTSDYAAAAGVDTIIICVPTPLRNREPDLSYIFHAVQQLKPYLKKGQLLVLESSTFPGTTEEYVKPLIETDALTVGETIFLGYSPERIDPGNKMVSIADIPKVISGVTPQCLQKVKQLYDSVFKQTVPVSSPKVAEFVKMLENSQRLINISFINEVNLLANKMNVDLWEVIEAAKTKPVGFTPYYPSAGIGGHCIPVDPFFLAWIGMREGVPLTMIHQAGFINEMIPHFIVSSVVQELTVRGKPLEEAHVGVIGLTYKKDVNDIRESASLKVIELLLDRRVTVSVHDPVFVGELPFDLKTFSLEPNELGVFDIVLILVDHSGLPWEGIVKHSRCVIDTRNVAPQLPGAHVVHL
ncbi:nucleotide sugar dehydrogenase [Brevibacillus sp. SYP-B805]|uniref:nucleotide sugar dehydrogenase n=1 Tax=Brevibacillus sp. SYP-B805 TaxID=1578199 RepID=UPI0013EA49CB|nr:nucleotide sugar dehydrogenase [Brevibacillus sp. SYP-B805]NGQ95717.1 nucleotide sugar dehydrogenase [Brevibacillus sp. SYP-B805]